MQQSFWLFFVYKIQIQYIIFTKNFTLTYHDEMEIRLSEIQFQVMNQLF